MCRIRALPSIALLALVPAVGVQGQCDYEVTLIKAPDCQIGGRIVYATALNDRGQVVGNYTDCFGQGDIPFVWSAETGFQLLPIPDGVSAVRPSDISDAGVIVGSYFRDGLGQRGFVYDDGVWTELPPAHPDGFQSYCTAINDAYQVVGDRTMDHPGLEVGFIWTPESGFTDLDPGLGPSRCTDITPDGTAVGAIGTFTKDEAMIWDGADSVQLLGVIPGGFSSKVRATNALGHLGGQGFFEGGPLGFMGRSFIWIDGEWTVIDPLPGDHSCGVRDMNDRDQMICLSSNAEGPDHSFLWHHGVVYDLNDLLPAGTDITITRPAGINNAGQLLASAKPSEGSGLHAALLTPTRILVGDVNSDCRVDASDLLLVLRNWGQICSAFDLDASGAVGFGDLLLVLSNWST